ncbi:Holliday junction branch migration DNA helicase RuvB [Candidatus Peregrinibacteria bacterium]|nr:Holliday junction branch migration DNA helicase RuvB [Candidatus Peregrinibacteria bacterium]
MIESVLESDAKLVESDSSFQSVFENRLRPTCFNEYIGQKSLKKNLLIAIEAAKKRGDPLDHTLLHGPPGLGKTTLANIIAREIGSDLKITSGPAFDKQGDVASIISNLNENDVLFIDEIHRLKPVIEEVLYTAMEDFAIDIIIGKGPSARSMRINLPPFTLIGATTKISMLSSPLRDRFGNVFNLEPYSNSEIKDIVIRSSRILDFDIEDNAAEHLAKTSRSTPRIANRLLKRVRDHAEVGGQKSIDSKILNKCLNSLGIDELGLDNKDREILSVIINKFNGGPVGVNTLSAAISEEISTIEEIYEPYLIKCGLLERTPRGRIATARASRHIQI